MDRELFALVEDAKRWLASRPEPQVLSPEWHTHNQLRLFIDLLQKDSSLASVEMAVQSLRRHIVSTFHWSADYCTTVSRFCSQADHVRRKMKGGAPEPALVPVEHEHHAERN